MQGRIQDFKLGEAHLRKLRRAEGGAKNFGVFRVKNHDLPPKIYIFSNFMGGGTPPGASIQKLINIDRSKTGRNFGINLKEVIDRFIWPIELCHIF